MERACIVRNNGQEHRDRPVEPNLATSEPIFPNGVRYECDRGTRVYSCLLSAFRGIQADVHARVGREACRDGNFEMDFAFLGSGKIRRGERPLSDLAGPVYLQLIFE